MNKYEKLKQYLTELNSVAVAFSGGADSTLLLKAARCALGGNVIAVTARSPLFPDRELNEAAAFCEKEGIRHFVFDTDPFSIEGFCENPLDRCYICKRAMFKKIISIARENGAKFVAEGSNTDDKNDYRPGMRAIAELGVKSPLSHAELTKSEIRALSEELGLPTAQKPSFACLATRFEYGDVLTPAKLSAAAEAEQLLIDLSFTQVRVRVQNKTARIEIMPAEFNKLLECREFILSEFNKLGFNYVSMDLKGYRSGSMNEALTLL